MYADDVILYFSGTTKSEVEEKNNALLPAADGKTGNATDWTWRCLFGNALMISNTYVYGLTLSYHLTDIVTKSSPACTAEYISSPDILIPLEEIN